MNHGELFGFSRPVADDAEISAASARAVLSWLVIASACLIADAVIGLRGIDVGTDTHIYVGYFLSMRHEIAPTRFEPGFVLFTRMLSASGMSVAAYQAALFGLSLWAAFRTARHYFDYLGGETGYLTFVSAALLFLFISPMFVNGSINAVRQGVASLMVFTALLGFYRRQWRVFFMYGALATSFHYSSLLYLGFAPILLLNLRLQRIIAGLGFLVYCTGLSMLVIRAAVPAVYATVMSYSAGATYRAGVRLDFAVFSFFWYLLPFVAARLVREPYSERIKQCSSVYLVMLLPFFAVGWGNYSNRYLLAPWVAVSFELAAMACFSRVAFLRNPAVLRVGLLMASLVFCYFVTQQVKI